MDNPNPFNFLPHTSFSPCARCSLTMTVTYDSELSSLFFENLRTRHSRTLLETVMPASHRIRRRLNEEDLVLEVELATYFTKAS
jgi:hypothetical protein